MPLAISLQASLAAKNLLETHQRIHIVCHRGPDGDALGSLIGLKLLIEHNLKGKTVSIHCVDPVPTSFRYLEHTAAIEHDLVANPTDLIVAVDCAEAHMTMLHERYPQYFDGTQPLLVLDHHVSNPQFGTLNVIDPQASSVCEMLTTLCRQWFWLLTPSAATALLTGVYTDTGGLKHGNTSSSVYHTVATLLRAGADRQTIITSVFRTAPLKALNLWGRVLEKVTISQEGGAVSTVTQGDFRATKTDHTMLDGAIDYLNAVPGIKFSLLLSERDGKVKGSLRTLRDDIDVAHMASHLNGGGHKKAAGFSMPGRLQKEVRWKVVE